MILLAALLYGYNQWEHGGGSAPHSSGMFAAYQQSEAELHQAAAGKWRAGDFKSVKQFHEWIHEGLRTARAKDFAPYGEAWNAFDKSQNGKVDKEAYARECERWAKTFGE